MTRFPVSRRGFIGTAAAALSWPLAVPRNAAAAPVRGAVPAPGAALTIGVASYSLAYLKGVAAGIRTS